MATDPTPDSKDPAANEPPAMTPYSIAVALFAAFVVGGVLGKAVPLWVVVVAGLAVGAAVSDCLVPGTTSAVLVATQPPRMPWPAFRWTRALPCELVPASTAGVAVVVNVA